MRFISTRALALGSALFAGIVLSGCSTTYSVNPDLVDQFESQPPPAADETDVYVIRGSQFYGGARGLWVAVNDHVVADLSNGSHVLLKLQEGINSIHGVQSTAGFAYAPVDFRGGETLFMVFDYGEGTLSEIPADLGKTMVMQTRKLQPLAEKRPNTALDNQLVNPSLLGLPIMAEATAPLQPDDNSAVITFFRPDDLISKVPFDIWSQDGYAGALAGGTYFEMRVKPGKHQFFARSERYSVLEAEVEAGKHYYVQFDVGMGWNQAHVKLLPMSAAEQKKQIDGYQNALTAMATDSAALQRPEVRSRIARGNDFLATIKQKVAADEVETRSLGPADGLVL